MPEYLKSLRDALTPLADALYDRQVRALGSADIRSAETWGELYSDVQGRRKRVGVKQTAWIILPPPPGTEAEFAPRIDELIRRLRDLLAALERGHDFDPGYEVLMADIDAWLDQHP